MGTAAGTTWNWNRTTESPWFYAACFCLFGGAVLLVTAEKYGKRQAGIERRFQARSQTAVAPPDGESAAPDDPSLGIDEDAAAAAYSSPEDTVIPLWPLGILLTGLACVFAALACRAGLTSKTGP